jgi:hypothetical protein
MMLDANATAPAALEAANASSPSPEPVADAWGQQPSTDESPVDANATAPAAQEAANASSPSPDPSSVSWGLQAPADAPSTTKFKDRVERMVLDYCAQRGYKNLCYGIDISGLTFVEDGFTEPKLTSSPQLTSAAFAGLACAYSDTPYKCSIDVSIDVEQKASSTTTRGYSLDTRLG